MPRNAACHTDRVRAVFRKTLSPQGLDALARETRLIRRQRKVTAESFFWAFMVTLGGQTTEYISDVLRTLNAQEGWTLRYKPFWDRLAQRAFCAFMKSVFERLCRELAVRVMDRVSGSAASRFSDILADDGSSFGVADALRTVFPGRFTKFKPAAVELHAHLSVLSGNLKRVTLAPDKEPERPFLPAPESLPKGSLSLRDRGYQDVSYFAALSRRGAYLICRAKRDVNPTIVRVVGGLPRRVAKKWEGKRLQQLRRTKLHRDLDLLVSWPRPNGEAVELRLVIRFVPEKKSWTWLLTNVPLDIAPETVGQLYRLRWQVELVFKDWKSYANLHALQSEHPAIVEGFIWASLSVAFLKRAVAHWAQLTTARPISTRLVAMSGRHLLPRLAHWARGGFTVRGLDEILHFLLHNALPTHPERRSAENLVGLRPRTRIGPVSLRAGPPRMTARRPRIAA